MDLALRLLTISSAISCVASWGQLGHHATALVASRFLEPHTARTVRQVLSPSSLVSASTWADYYSHTPAGRYSAAWHWIDAHDSPPSSCGVSYSRDCPEASGCIVSAIANQTQRAMDQELGEGERNMALKWVVHFLGDIHQPLHTENLERGGNGVEVLWEGKKSNLHHVWDSAIAEKMVGGNTIQDSVRWADGLYEDIVGERWNGSTARWGECLDIGNAAECALRWAEETNTLMCSYVLPKDWDQGGLVGAELAGAYYEGARVVVETQVAIAGWRMAQWLNKMFPEEEREELWLDGVKEWGWHTEEL